ncbi:hypothetical protein TRVA0_001S04236 [Trichomonascus vanleenenianus]|uniref:uncharacterized protein n=1 Tax=Trichomonascus vanleenenianus TaxID=2268995 RepID=UPI003ECBA642
MTHPHPFDQLTTQELAIAMRVLKQHHPGKTVHIKSVGSEEPPKKLMVPYLAAEKAGRPIPPPPRIAHCIYYVMEEKQGNELWININEQKVVRYQSIAKGQHPPIDFYEAGRICEIFFKSEEFKAALQRCNLDHITSSCVEVDGWMYGCDDPVEVPRLMMMLVYCRDPKANNKDSNLYAFPLPFVPVYDVLEDKLVRIDWCATGGDDDDIHGFNYNTRPDGKNAISHCVGNEYVPELQEQLRTDLKPYNVVQPEGPSFDLDGNLVKWQKWRFRVGFTPREGLVLHDVDYDGRNVFYRLSVSEMAVPYGDPRPPLHRKMAFDFGDCGAGRSANELNLGCDCLGTIKYFDGNIVEANGNVLQKKSVICMHEQDDGILWKHTNYRTNRACVTRRRILVVQSILTVGNYEYIFAWHLDQAAGISLEVRATGIVSTQPIDEGKRSQWGNIVSPGALAATHQHIFSMRIDPAIDGHNNTAIISDTKPVPWDEKNPYGTAFRAFATPVETSMAFDHDVYASRSVKMVNENKKNPVSGNPVGYKLIGAPTALLMAQPGSIARSRAAFATQHYWVTKYQDQELYAGGVWTNQSAKEIGGVKEAVDRKDKVRNEDIVLWHSFGLTHNVRVEDFPVMPTEMLKVQLIPSDFFTKNPAIDVPPSTQAFNRSVDVMAKRSCHL